MRKDESGHLNKKRARSHKSAADKGAGVRPELHGHDILGRLPARQREESGCGCRRLPAPDDGPLPPIQQHRDRAGPDPRDELQQRRRRLLPHRPERLHRHLRGARPRRRQVLRLPRPDLADNALPRRTGPLPRGRHLRLPRRLLRHRESQPILGPGQLGPSPPTGSAYIYPLTFIARFQINASRCQPFANSYLLQHVYNSQPLPPHLPPSSAA
jgi:hypothetical protein